jgi:hypothetical protein
MMTGVTSPLAPQLAQKTDTATIRQHQVEEKQVVGGAAKMVLCGIDLAPDNAATFRFKVLS